MATSHPLFLKLLQPHPPLLCYYNLILVSSLTYYCMLLQPDPVFLLLLKVHILFSLLLQPHPLLLSVSTTSSSIPFLATEQHHPLLLSDVSALLSILCVSITSSSIPYDATTSSSIPYVATTSSSRLNQHRG